MSVRERKRVVRDDDKFFKRYPNRRYRVRRASPVEIREKQLNGGLPSLPRGEDWFLAIWRPAPGRRICLFIPTREDVSTDLDEVTARALFDILAGDPHAPRH